MLRRAGLFCALVAATTLLSCGVASAGVYVNNGATYTNTLQVSIAFPGESGRVYQISNSNSWFSSTWYAVPFGAISWTLQSGSDGNRYVYARFRNTPSSGSTELSSDSIVLDTTPPVTTASGGSSSGWVRSAVISLSAHDYGSGVDYIEYSFNPSGSWQRYYSSVTIDRQDQSTIYFRAVDRAGNFETVKSKAVQIDATPPVSSIAGIPSGWVKWAHVSLSAQDSGSGVDYIQYSFTSTFPSQHYYSSLTVDREDQSTVYFRAVDRAGNVEATQSRTMQIDTTPPTTSDNHLSASLVAPAMITLTPRDARSGTTGGSAKTEYRVDADYSWRTGTTVTLAVGTHTVRYRSADYVGNVETPDKSFTVTVRAAKAPTASSTYSFASDSRSAWHNTDQTVILTASGGDGTGRTIHYSSDGGASWATSPGDTTTVTLGSEGSHHFKYYASDSLATEAAQDAGYVNIDKTAPTTATKSASIKAGQTVILKFRVSDAMPGCGRAVVKIEISKGAALVKTIAFGSKATNSALRYRYRAALKKGSYTWRVLATDVAGNVASNVGSSKLLVK